MIAELILLAVVPLPSPEAESAVAEYARVEQVAATKLVLATADNRLVSARRKAQAKGVTRISAEPSFGDPAQEIIATAWDRRADVIVVGSRGHGRLAGLLLGSVAQKIVTLAHCPVVVVR